VHSAHFPRSQEALAAAPGPWCRRCGRPGRFVRWQEDGAGHRDPARRPGAAP